MMVERENLDSRPVAEPMQLDAWSFVLLKRNGAPPLRLKARQISCVSDTSMKVRLWQHKTRGFVADLATPLTSTAARHDDILGAMGWLEKIVTDAEIACERGAPSGRTREAIVDTHSLRKFRVLAGETLAEWDLLLENQQKELGI